MSRLPATHSLQRANAAGPNGVKAEYPLSLQQKRQATLLYHWMSLDYLRGLKDLIDALIKGADVHLELAQRQGRDALLTNKRWGVRDTSANWSTNVYPALEDFRKSTIKLIAWRASEIYCGTGANQCGRMISEFSSSWMTEEEEKQFKNQFEAVYRYASYIDDAAGLGGRRMLNSLDMVADWRNHESLFPRLPKFRVRTDVEVVTGKRPLRTGVYVAQDDTYATLQFAWTGAGEGQLGEALTFNEIGLRMVSAIGRDALWNDERAMAAFALAEMARNPKAADGPYTPEEILEYPSCANPAMSIVAHEFRPTKWYYVERVEGEFDEEADTPNPAIAHRLTAGMRVEAGQRCPQAGYWFTPARANSRQRFEAGQTMPDVGGAWGATIWQWDAKQAP